MANEGLDQPYDGDPCRFVGKSQERFQQSKRTVDIAVGRHGFHFIEDDYKAIAVVVHGLVLGSALEEARVVTRVSCRGLINLSNGRLPPLGWWPAGRGLDPDVDSGLLASAEMHWV